MVMVAVETALASVWGQVTVTTRLGGVFVWGRKELTALKVCSSVSSLTAVLLKLSTGMSCE
jgi:hypothetical protein